jgi:hypothetical protein
MVMERIHAEGVVTAQNHYSSSNRRTKQSCGVRFLGATSYPLVDATQVFSVGSCGTLHKPFGELQFAAIERIFLRRSN